MSSEVGILIAAKVSCLVTNHVHVGRVGLLLELQGRVCVTRHLLRSEDSWRHELLVGGGCSALVVS